MKFLFLHNYFHSNHCHHRVASSSLANPLLPRKKPSAEPPHLASLYRVYSNIFLDLNSGQLGKISSLNPYSIYGLVAGKHATKHWANTSSPINPVFRKRNNVQTWPPQRKTHTNNFLWKTLQLCPVGFGFGISPNQKWAPQKKKIKSHQPLKHATIQQKSIRQKLTL